MKHKLDQYMRNHSFLIIVPSSMYAYWLNYTKPL